MRGKEAVQKERNRREHGVRRSQKQRRGCLWKKGDQQHGETRKDSGETGTMYNAICK